jgi:hypothetical protein
VAPFGEEFQECAADVGKAFHGAKVVTALKNLVTLGFSGPAMPFMDLTIHYRGGPKLPP